jgi:DNA polymerase-3 subunit delta
MSPTRQAGPPAGRQHPAVAAAPIHLVKGDDPVLVGDAVRDLVAELVGDGDRSLMVEELDATSFEDDRGAVTIGPLADAAQTPPFLTERRIVVARHGAVFSTNDSVAPLVAYLADPLPTTSIVLVWEKGPKSGARTAAVPKKLGDAVKAAGGVVHDTKPGTGRQRSAWLDQQLATAPVALDGAATAMLAAHLGEDVSRLRGLLETLASTFGAGARLSDTDIEPYLGDAGDVAPWDLTDAIDRGDPAAALDVLHRMLGAGRHPLQITASLHGHYGRMLRLEGSGVGSEAQAAELLGLKGSTFPARKALDQVRTLGPERLHEFIGLLADADLDLRGARAWPSDLVVEVLVARLAARTPRSRAGSARRR